MTPTSMLIMNIFLIVYSVVSYALIGKTDEITDEGITKKVVTTFGIVYSLIALLSWIALPFTVYNLLK